MTAVESNSGHSAVLHCPTANLARPPKPFVQLPRPCFQLWRARHVVGLPPPPAGSTIGDRGLQNCADECGVSVSSLDWAVHGGAFWFSTILKIGPVPAPHLWVHRGLAPGTRATRASVADAQSNPPRVILE
jgi:hypothetical protein